MLPTLKDLSPNEVGTAIEANLIGYQSDLGRSPHVELHNDTEITWFISEQPAGRLNRIIRAHFHTNDITHRIQAAIEPYASRNLPMTWHTGPSTFPDDLNCQLKETGLIHLGNEPGLAADLTTLQDTREPPDDLIIKRVTDIRSLRDWSEVMTRSFDGDITTANSFYKIERSILDANNPSRQHFLGLLKGNPVGTATLFLGAGVAGLYSVTAVPEFRRAGIGTAMTAFALNEARKIGYRISTLHASRMGVKVYLHLGFMEYCRLGRYMWKGN
ncbi:GNAT family N-acetyltransferase [Chloroflexota bacterium]